MRWNDQGPLPARSRHVIRLLGHREAAVPVDPEEGTIDRTLVSFPRGSKRAHELGVAFGKNPLAVPDAVLEIKIAEARPIATAGELVALGEKIPIRVGVHDHRADADLVEQRPLRERKIVFSTFLHGEANEIVDQHRIAVAVATDRVGRPLQWPPFGPLPGPLQNIELAEVSQELFAATQPPKAGTPAEARSPSS